MLWSQFSAIFAKFSAKKLAFLSKTNVMIKIFCDFRQYSAIFCTIQLRFDSKTSIYSLNFSAKIFLKIISSVSRKGQEWWKVSLTVARKASQARSEDKVEVSVESYTAAPALRLFTLTTQQLGLAVSKTNLFSCTL
jgi:hypothetical protein